MENHVDGTRMVYHIQPVAHILTLAVYGQRFAVTDVVDKQRDQLLWELIRTVVVRTVRYDGRHAVCIVEGTYKVVAAGFRCRIRAVRIVFCIFIEKLHSISQMMLSR